MSIATPLTAEQKAQWLAALRSGEWKQGHGQLRCDDAYCCLGVLAELLGRLDDDGRYLGDSDACFWTGGDYEVLPEDAQQILINTNDDGNDFATIADWIEANVEVAP